MLSSTTMSRSVPRSLESLFWDVDLAAIDLQAHADYVLERIMSRGTWEAMQWLRGAYSLQTLADFLRRKGARLPPRERAYWCLIAGMDGSPEPGGGRPVWAGP